MSFSLTKFIKGLRISKENSVNPSNIDIIPGGTAGTTTTLTSTQTAARSISLPNLGGTILTTDSIIDLDQLEALASLKAVSTDFDGHLQAATTTATELNYLTGTTSAVQTQLNTLTTNLANEASTRAADDALKANLTLNNILPTASVNVNGQKVTNAGTPTVPSDLTTKAYVDSAVTGGGANLTLSNLTSPTAINQHLLSGNPNTYNIGSSSNRFANTHTTTLFVDQVATTSGTGVLHTNTSLLYGNGTLKMDFSGTNVSFNTRKLTDVVNPTAAQDVATKDYVDGRTDNTNKLLLAKYTAGGAGYPSPGVFPAIYQTIVRNDFGGTPYNTTTGVFTVPISGKYQIAINYYASLTSSDADFVVRKNATLYTLQSQTTNGGPGGFYSFSINMPIILAATDTIDVSFRPNGSSSANADTIGVTFFSAIYLGV